MPFIIIKIIRWTDHPIKQEQLAPVNLLPCQHGSLIIKKYAEDLTQQIKYLTSVPAEIYKTLYLNTLHRFAEFCQAMPWDESCEPYSLLRKQLGLCITALKIRRGLLLPKGAASEAIAQQEPYWTYAIFSASLFYHLNRIQQDRQISLYNAQGEQTSGWHPLVGSLYETEMYYSIEWKHIKPVVFNNLIAGLIGKIVPSTVIKWLTQNPLVLKQWWKSITGNENNVIGNIIDEAAQANKYSRENNINTAKVYSKSLAELNHSQVNATIINQDSLSFLDSLLSYLSEKSKLENNEPTWLRVERGLFINKNALNDISAYHEAWKDSSVFIETIKTIIISNKEQYFFCYRPKIFEDRRIVNGFILKEECLDEFWKKQPINLEFMPAVNL